MYTYENNGIELCFLILLIKVIGSMTFFRLDTGELLFQLFSSIITDVNGAKQKRKEEKEKVNMKKRTERKRISMALHFLSRSLWFNLFASMTD